ELRAMLDCMPQGVDHQALLAVVVHDPGYGYDGDEQPESSHGDGADNLTHAVLSWCRSGTVRSVLEWRCALKALWMRVCMKSVWKGPRPRSGTGSGVSGSGRRGSRRRCSTRRGG